MYIVSGPSGAGKGTIVQGVVARRPDLYLAVSTCTRPARPMEREGVHYHFVSERDFMAKRERGEFLEWAQVHGNYYGTSRTEVLETLAKGKDVLLEIDVQGATQVKSKMQDAVLIFIEAPSFAELEGRLRRRGTEKDEAIEKRLADAYDELRKKQAFDAVIVNDDVDRAVDAVLEVMDRFKEMDG